MKFPLTAMISFRSSRGNTELSTIRDLLGSFEEWKGNYERWAREHRERASKLELIGDKDASWERRQRDSAEEDCAKCDVAIRALSWVIANYDRLPEPTQ